MPAFIKEGNGDVRQYKNEVNNSYGHSLISERLEFQFQFNEPV